MCGECQNSAKCICFECMANDMFCFIYIGHGFGKGHGFLHGTDLKVSFILILEEQKYFKIFRCQILVFTLEAT